ncbi:MAG: putative rane protein [Candidatus Saccharibacteria bacterium]|nr:putative rane protein [Candidatus Saccharibacteria bacterium]
MLMYELLKSRDFRIWLAIMGSATLIIGASYAMVQQSTRLAANDLPLSTAQLVKKQLEGGANPSDVVPTQTVNLRDDSGVFIIVADSSRHVLAGSAALDGQTPLPPKGTFDYTAKHGLDSFTWQPTSKVRLATQVVNYGQSPNTGFVITGQSLAPAEDRVDVYTELAVAAWLAILAWTYLTLLMPESTFARKKTKK